MYCFVIYTSTEKKKKEKKKGTIFCVRGVQAGEKTLTQKAGLTQASHL